MPAVSKAQQRFMGMVHAADKGETPASPEVAKVSADMKDSDAKDFASTSHDGLPDHVKEQLKSVVREVIREKSGMNEMSGNDVHFKHIMKLYDRGGSFTKKKIGAVVCKNPKASRKDVEEELFDADYKDIIEFEDELGLKEIREKYSSVKEDAAELPPATIPAAVKAKLQLAIDKIKDSKLSNNAKLQLLAQVIDAIGIDKSQLSTIASKIRSKMESVVTEEFKHVIHVDTPTQVVSKPVAAQIMALAKKGVRASEIGLEMGFVGNAKLAADTFQKVKNKIYFELDKRNESVNENLDNYSKDAITDMIINLSRYEGNEELIADLKKILKQRTLGKLKKEQSINEDIKSDVNKFLDKLNKEFPDQEYTTDFKGGKYARITHQSRKFGQPSAWGFIAMDDNPSKGFQKGDLLKAAGFNTPAKHARGNILNGDAKYDKYSPTYLKESVNEEALPKDGSTIKVSNIPVKIEYVSNKKYIGYSWKDKNNKEHYEETKTSDHSNLNSLIKTIKINLDESVNEAKFKSPDYIISTTPASSLPEQRLGHADVMIGLKLAEKLKNYTLHVRHYKLIHADGKVALKLTPEGKTAIRVRTENDPKYLQLIQKTVNDVVADYVSKIKESVNEAKPSVVGNMNAYGPSKVLGKGGKVLGFVPDTPNAIATLIQDYPTVQAIEFKSSFFFNFNSYKSIKKGDKAWKELMSRGVDKATKAALKKDFELKESVNEAHDCGCNENHDCGCGGVHEHHIKEDLSADANGIAGLTASRASAVKDFLEKNNINSNKLYLFLKKGNLKDRMDFVTALVGKPGNTIQQKVIKQFSN